MYRAMEEGGSEALPNRSVVLVAVVVSGRLDHDARHRV